MKTSNEKRKKLFIRSIPWTVLDGAFNLFYSIGMVVLLGRFLTASDLGLAGIALAVTQIVEATYASGIQESVVRATSGHTRLSDTAHTLALSFSLLGAFLCCFLAWPLALAYGDSSITILIIVASLGLPINALFSIPTAKLSRKIRTKVLTSRMIISKSFSATAFLICALSGFGSWSIIFATLASSVGSLVLIILQTNRMPKFGYDKNEAKEILHYGIISSAGTFAWIVASRIFSLLFGFFHGVEALGFFQFAQKMCDELAALLQVTIIRIGLPFFAGINREGRDVSSTFLLGTRILNTLSVPVYTGLMLLAPTLIPLVFGNRWNAAIPMLWILASSWIFVFSNILIPVVLRAQGVPKYNLSFSLITALVALIAVLLTSWLSPIASVVGWGIAQLANLPYQLYVIKKRLGLSFFEQIRQTFPALAASLGMAGCLLLYQKTVSDISPIEQNVISVLIGGLSYSIFIFVFDRSLVLKVRDILVNTVFSKK